MNALITQIQTFAISNTNLIISILMVIFLGGLFLNILTTRIVKHANKKSLGGKKRARTLANLLNTAGKILIAGVSFIFFLQMFGINPIPILAGASVMGVALALGAQTLIKDFLAGIFIFTENQYAVGDTVKIGTVEGIVHSMTMRITIIEDLEGDLVFIPNSSIINVVNKSLGDRNKKMRS